MSLELVLLQHIDETSKSVICIKKDKIGKSAAKPRIEERSTASPKGRRNNNSEMEQPKFLF